MRAALGHISATFDQGTSWVVALAASATLLFGLIVVWRAHVAKHARWVTPAMRPILATVVVGALVMTVTPSAISQERTDFPVGLPDLISDPPFPWFDKVVVTPEGEQIKVIAFDGYLHNAGDGMLDLVGNPQEPDGMVQRYWDGDEWVEVGRPFVQYETTDGHNHFHLMAAAEYELWDEAQTEKIGDSAKVGFCLIDTEQRAERVEGFYQLGIMDYCGKDRPDATDLRMGISPGWVDVYDANTTLQWVDVSDIRPGRYWIGAIMDPTDQIVESNEENNDLVFSEVTFTVTGFVARPLETQIAGEPIELKADAFGQVGPLVFEIVEAPSNGTLDVPAGVDVHWSEVTYVPNEGFEGIDTFTYIAEDAHSEYPRTPVEVRVEVDASGYDGERPEPAGSAGAPFADDLTIDVNRYESFAVDAADGDAEPYVWFADDLPPGLIIDHLTGRIEGVPTEGDRGVATLVAAPSGSAREFTDRRTVEWTVTDEGEQAFHEIGDFSMPTSETLRLRMGLGTAGATYTATGLPVGIRMVDNTPLLTGTTTQIGEYDVEITETLDGEVTNSTAFRLTVTAAAKPAFPL